MPAIPGAVDAAVKLHQAGYELACVSAMNFQFQSARLKNMQNLGFSIERIIATDNYHDQVNPKAAVLHALKPVAFVDDYLPYLFGISAGIHKALIMREPNGSPNIGPLLASAHSQHDDLAEFANWWIDRDEKQKK
ncbi:hypothetical protein [Undibacterium sp.]|uniref:hypothetical protein n=1 Tax=Undibacterium sp. TaxID=1914977 RepID=UPI00351CDA00